MLSNFELLSQLSINNFALKLIVTCCTCMLLLQCTTQDVQKSAKKCHKICDLITHQNTPSNETFDEAIC